MSYDPEGYCGGVLPEEKPLVEKFEELIPYFLKNGPKIGEAAMKGDMDAELVIQGYHRFVKGMPHLRQRNFEMCVSALKRWEAKGVS